MVLILIASESGRMQPGTLDFSNDLSACVSASLIWTRITVNLDDSPRESFICMQVCKWREHWQILEPTERMCKFWQGGDLLWSSKHDTLLFVLRFGCREGVSSYDVMLGMGTGLVCAFWMLPAIREGGCCGVSKTIAGWTSWDAGWSCAGVTCLTRCCSSNCTEQWVCSLGNLFPLTASLASNCPPILRGESRKSEALDEGSQLSELVDFFFLPSFKWLISGLFFRGLFH